MRSWERRQLLLLLLRCAALGACSRSGLLSPEAQRQCVAVQPGHLSTLIVPVDVVIRSTDILFLIDNSSSMNEEIQQIRSRLSSVIAPAIRAQVPDTDLGVAVCSDFGERVLGQPSHPYRLLQPITQDVERVVQATKQIKLEYGGDEPESQLEALYQAATGIGYGSYIQAKTNCPPGTRGGVCFRDGSFSVVMLFTDAPMRNVAGLLPDGSATPPVAYDPFAPDAPYIPYVRGYDETITALRQQNMHVIGLWSGGDGPGSDDLRRVASDSGALDANGQPIVFDIGDNGEVLGEGVVQTLQALTTAVRADVQLDLTDGDKTDAIDATTLVTAVQALRAEPAGGAMSDGESFRDVVPGTRVFFELTIDVSSVPTSDADQRFPLFVRAKASDGRILQDQTLDILVQRQARCD